MHRCACEKWCKVNRCILVIDTLALECICDLFYKDDNLSNKYLLTKLNCDQNEDNQTRGDSILNKN